MDNNNPAEMSNEDLEKDMQKRKLSGGQENVNKSTAAEGALKTPAEDASSAVRHHSSYKGGDEQDLDDLVHRRAQEEDSHNGSLPNPEDVPAWEGDEIDDDKITG